MQHDSEPSRCRRKWLWEKYMADGPGVTPSYLSHVDMLALSAYLDLFTPPDPALRQPFTSAAFVPFYSSYYSMAVLVILPHTFILGLSLLPFVLWQAWRSAVGLNCSAGLALSLGGQEQ